MFEIRAGHGSCTISFFSPPLARLLPPPSASGGVRLLRALARLLLRTPPPLAARRRPARRVAIPRAPRRRLAGEDASVTFNISNSAFQHFHASNFNIHLYMFNILMSNVESVYEKY